MKVEVEIPEGIRRLIVEHRKEYERGEIITCPNCDGVNLECDDPEQAKCLDCGCKFRTITVAIWED